MKTRIVIFCAIIAAICIWFLWPKQPQKSTNIISTNTALQNAPAQPAPNTISHIKPSFTNHSPDYTTNGLFTNIVQREEQRKILEEQIRNQWRTPIEFYGIVEDESNNVVARAQINYSCNDTSPTGTSFYHTQSDENGSFIIKGVQGLLLEVDVSKEGYYSYDPHGQYFYYAGKSQNFVPDANNPVVFRLRKKGKGESLIQKDFPPMFTQIWQLHHDGAPIELDLLNGSQNVNGSGQLKLEFWRDLTDRNAKQFDWKLRISAAGGSLVPTGEEFAFAAPETGWQPSVVVDMPATNQAWQGELRSRYYIRLANGDYGRLDFYLLPYNGAFTVHSAVNPSGSRNLEPK